jgi:group II intron reverse transcriptase/maturase
MESKDKIRDSIQRTRDHLRKVISILGLETKTLNYILELMGDGEIIVPTYLARQKILDFQAGLRKGFQDSIANKNRTRSLLHSTPLLKANAKGYYLKPDHSRYISSESLKDIEVYKKAYNKMKSNPGNMTPGTDNETLDRMSIARLNKLRISILNWTYECKPTKRVYIPKASGKVRPLGIPSIMDKLLQIILKDLIEPKCEEIFHPMSFGFRPQKSVHHALIEVQRMRGITWIIEGDIKGYFDNIDHQIMIDIIKERLNPDRTMMGIIWKFFRAGYIEESQYKHSILGVPQGGILSPILSNLYLTPFDEFIDSLKTKYNSLPISERNPEYRRIEWHIGNLRRKLIKPKFRTLEEINAIKKEIVENNIKMRTLPSVRRIGVQIHYVRYADDWVIGITGPHELAVKIREEVRTFLKDSLRLELSMEKTKITHLGSEFAKFLGHYIRASTLTQNISSRRISIDGKLLNWRKSTGKPKILVPINLIKQKLIDYGFGNEKGFPKYVGRFLFLSDYDIIQRYNSILRGFMNFYNMAENRSSLNELVYILEYSLAHTLGAKHQLSLKQVFKKYGKPIRAKLSGLEKAKTVVFDKPISLSAEYLNDKYARTTRYGKALAFVEIDPLQKFINRIKERNILELPCIICGTEDNIEMHHLKRLKDTKDKSTLIKVMSTMRRKTIPLCMACHDKVHAGKYDGLSLREIKNML